MGCSSAVEQVTVNHLVVGSIPTIPAKPGIVPKDVRSYMYKFLALILVANTAIADVRYYTEFKNDMLVYDTHYVDNTASNNLRFGMQGDVFYAEAGPVYKNHESGTGYELGYKYDYSRFQFKGKFEGYQFDSFEGKPASKFETEVRYYFK